MSTGKRVILPYNLLPGSAIGHSNNLAATQAAASGVTTPVNIQYYDNICFQMIWTGTVNGTFVAQGSLDGTNWTTFDSNVNNPAGNPGSALLDLNQLSFPLVRLSFTLNSGSGNMTINVGGKAL